MADITNTLSLNWNYGNQQVAVNVEVTADTMVRQTISVAGSTTDKLVNIAIDVSELKVLYLYSDEDVMIQTNSGSSPNDTINLAAGKPCVWYTGCGITNPLTVDVTKFYLTNAGSDTATVEIAVLQDGTP